MHEQRLGYRRERRIIILNGFDTETFVPSAEARTLIRNELGLAKDLLLIGWIGRFHAAQDPFTFLKALACIEEMNLEGLQW